MVKKFKKKKNFSSCVFWHNRVPLTLGYPLPDKTIPLQSFWRGVVFHKNEVGLPLS